MWVLIESQDRTLRYMIETTRITIFWVIWDLEVLESQNGLQLLIFSVLVVVQRCLICGRM